MENMDGLIQFTSDYYPSIKFNALKEKVRFRDNYKCKICGCSQLENGRQLDVHHKDYNKENNELNNLVALCKSCHTKTTNSRKYWTKYFSKRV